MAMRKAKALVLGLSWKQLSNKADENLEIDELNSPRTRASVKQSNGLGEKNSTLRRTLSRMQSVRDVFGTLRQKIRTSTRRRKRLINASPYTPKRRAGNMTSTPTSVQRRSARIAKQNDEKMYSPFNVDTPSKTPSKIRMGIHEPKRFQFSSPGQLHRDVNSLADGIRALTDIGNKLTTERRTGIRTTPKTVRSKPVFI